MLSVTAVTMLTTLVLHCPGALGQNTKMAFDETKDAETIRVVTGADGTDQIVGASSDANRRYTNRVKLFDDIFNV